LVWRQLWRVIESSDLIIQVILLEKRRSRQPEKFFCHAGDFEKVVFNGSYLESLRLHQHVIPILEYWEKKRPRQINRSVLVIW
jgi:hypothetical protein